MSNQSKTPRNDSALSLFSDKIRLFNVISRLKNAFNQTRKTLLVIDSNSWVTHAAVLKMEDDNVTVESSCATATSQPNDDLSVLLADLTQKTIDLPKHAILISSQLIPTLIELPNDPDNPISDSQMQEFVRWESELVVNEQSTAISVIERLLQQNAMTLAELDACITGLNIPLRSVSPANVQKALLQDNIITQEQLDKCLSLRQSNLIENEDIECAWSQTTEQGTNTKSLCVGMKLDYKLEWLQAFEKHQIHLERILSPQLCCAYAIAKHIKIEEYQSYLLLDIGLNNIGLQKISNNKIIEQTYLSLNQKIVAPPELQSLITNYLDDNVASVYYQGTHPQIQSLAFALKDTLSITIKPSTQFLQQGPDNPDSNNAEQQALIRIRHSAQAITDIQTHPLVLAINGHPPAPALYRQRKFQFATASLIVILAIATHQRSLNGQLTHIETDYKRTMADLEKSTATNEKIENINTEVADLEKQLTTLNKKHNELGNRNHLIESIMVQRQRFAESLLPMLENTIPKEVILLKVTEDEWYQFSIEGWALDQGSVDNFNSVLSRNLEQWNMYISDSPSRFDGEDLRYNFTFVISLKDA